MPEVTLEIQPPKERPAIDAEEVTDHAPDKAAFESDQNSKAASDLPVTGSTPLPSQQGLVQKELELKNQQYTPGEEPAVAAGNPPTPPTPPQQQEAKPEPTPASTATPESSATPEPTPTIPPPPNSVKLLDLPKEEPTPERAKQPPLMPQHPVLPPPQPGAPGPKKGFQEETRQTVVYGSISNRGRSSVAAEATPLGRYKKKISTAIGSRWYFYTNESAPNIGTVTVSFKVTASGKITALRVLSGSGNSALTDCTLRSIMEAKIPPMPPEVAAPLQDGSIEYESFSFTIY